MKYSHTVKGRFISRPNRFVAHVEVKGREEICHVKNTGRCRELLMPNAEVILEQASNPLRKTKYDVIAVRKGERLINMDSQIPNYVAEEWLKKGLLFSKEAVIQREKRYGNSRFDLYIEDKERRIFMEVKGVTLEENNVAKFPDAPTKRGVKHIKELIECQKEGFQAYLLFVIQMKGILYMTPNWNTHREFGEALIEAKKAGVNILAYDCIVKENEIILDQPVPVILEEK